MRVDFYALLRSIAGTDFIFLDLPPETDVHSLLSTLITQFQVMLPHLLDSAGNLRDDVPIFVNGRNPRLAPNGLNKPIPPDGVVSIFSPIASGKMNVETLRK